MIRGKTVFITGAASGIGLEIGRAFLMKGAKVAFTDMKIEMIKEVVRPFQKEGFNCVGLSCDVTKENDIQHAIKQTMKQLGRIDILINNAGLQHIAFIEDLQTEKFSHLIKVMLIGPFMTIKHIFPFMKQQHFGRIINIASINGLVGFSGKAAYNSAKHGIIGLSKVAALEGAEHGITVNSLCPGYVDTPLVQNQLKDLAENRKVPIDHVLEDVIYPLIPQRRLIEVQEVADYVLFLASDKAKSVTGQAVVMDGGYTVQ